MSRSLHFGLVGHNISYTLSPAIFEALFAITGKSGDFTVIDVPSAGLGAELEKMRAWDGFSVTVPHKQSVISEMSFVSEAAREIGAINSVRVKERKFFGHNTDADGFILPMREFCLNRPRILILGNGGAARAVMWALIREYPRSEICVCGRDKRKVGEFIDNFRFAPGGNGKAQALSYDDIGKNDRYDLVINCTPVGSMACPDLSPLPESFGYEGCQVCYDLNYRPARTLFLQRAEAAGCRIIGGLPMLVRQAVMSYNIWTGSESEIEKVSNEVMELLRKDNRGVDV